MIDVRDPALTAAAQTAARTVALPALQTLARVSMQTPGGGTISVAPTIYREWVSLSNAQTATGESVQAELGWPLDDVTLSTGVEVTTFERGAIVLRRDGRAFAIYGAIYLHYRELFDLRTQTGSFNPGMPLSEEQAVAGGRRQAFDYADISWNASTNAAFEVHGAIRDKYNALGGIAGFLGYPLSDELSVKRSGREIGRSQDFAGGSIYWSGATGAFSVHGAIRDAYVNRYGGPAGSLGFPLCDETPTPANVRRYNDFEHGCIAWTAASGAIDVYTSLELFIQNINGSGSHTFAESMGFASVWLYANCTIASNTGINATLRFPQSGDYGKPSADPGDVFSVTTIRGGMVLNVTIDGWDKCDLQSDVHLGTIRATFSLENGFGVNAPQQLNDGDFHGLLGMRNTTSVSPMDPNFRRAEFWGFVNHGTPVLSRQQYAETFGDVESSESDLHWFDDLFYNDFFKTIAAGGNCFGMALESCFADRGDSLFSEPIFPIADPVAMPEINLKQAYQLSGQMIDYYVAEFLSGQTWNPMAVYQAACDAYFAGDEPLICLTDATRGEGHCVRPCGPQPFRDTATTATIYVANSNAPATDDSEPANQIVIDKATNTYRFVVWPGGPTWTGGHYSGGIISWVPFSVLSCQPPRTPFWEVVVTALGLGMLMLGEGASTAQITDDAGRTLYRPERVGTSNRWDDLRVDAGKIPGLVRIPFHAAFLSRGPMIGGTALNAALRPAPSRELYRLVGLPSPFGPAPRQSAMPAIGGPVTTGIATAAHAAIATNGTAAALAVDGRAATIANAIGAPPAQLTHEVVASSGSPYRWGFHTAGSAMMATVAGGSGSDAFVVDRVGAVAQQLTLKPAKTGGARTAQLLLRSRFPGRTAVFTVDNVSVPAGASFSASVLGDGRTLQLQNAGGDGTVTIAMQGANNQSSGVKTLAIPAGKTAVVTPADWEALPSAAVNVNILSAPGGQVEQTLQL